MMALSNNNPSPKQHLLSQLLAFLIENAWQTPLAPYPQRPNNNPIHLLIFKTSRRNTRHSNRMTQKMKVLISTVPCEAFEYLIPAVKADDLHKEHSASDQARPPLPLTDSQRRTFPPCPTDHEDCGNGKTDSRNGNRPPIASH